MTDFPTDAEVEAIYDLAVNLGHISDDGWTISARAAEIDETVRGLIAAREAAAWDAGAEAAWERSTPEVNGLHYWWRSYGEPLNPYRQEADDDRD